MVETVKYQNSNRVHSLNVGAIRKRFGLTRQEFAAQFGFSPKDIRDYESGLRIPAGSHRVLFILLDRDPETVIRILSEVV